MAQAGDYFVHPDLPANIILTSVMAFVTLLIHSTELIITNGKSDR